MPDGVIIRLTPFTDYKPDPDNLNEHSERGEYMVRDSIGRDGIGRGYFVSDDGTILGGNLTHEIIGDLMQPTHALEIVTDGHVPIVHRRKDITDPRSDRARALATADNRSAQVSFVVNPAALQQLPDAVRDRYFFADEVTALLAGREGIDIDDPESEGFAEGVQFNVTHFAVVIPLTETQFNNTRLKHALLEFCKQHGLVSRIKKA